ncbi:hypothetical protein GcC1_153019, partial [Golovinomyces cichoracearum]
ILPEYLVNPFRDFVADLNIVARCHFDRHVKGTPRPTPPYAMSKEERVGPNATVSNENPSITVPSQIKYSYATVTETLVPHFQDPIPPKPT